MATKACDSCVAHGSSRSWYTLPLAVSNKISNKPKSASDRSRQTAALLASQGHTSVECRLQMRSAVNVTVRDGHRGPAT